MDITYDMPIHHADSFLSSFQPASGRQGMTLDDFKKIDAFFAAGDLTVYASTENAWRWRACAGGIALQAKVIDPLRCDRNWVLDDFAQANAKNTKRKRHKKTFEESRLVKWLTRATTQTREKNSTPQGYNGNDALAFAAFIGMDISEWAALNRTPPLNAMEIRHFEVAHNAALSDIESAFLNDKFDLPPELSSFYVRYLTRARRDTEASLIIAQSSGSLHLPALCADALAIASFEGAAHNPLVHDATLYAVSAAYDTSALIDAALKIAGERLTLPVDHSDHLLRLGSTKITRLASEIVENHALAPFPFLIKAKALYLARADVCRFPPIDRFATAVNEQDLGFDTVWITRAIMAYKNIFDLEINNPFKSTEKTDRKIVNLKR